MWEVRGVEEEGVWRVRGYRSGVRGVEEEWGVGGEGGRGGGGVEGEGLRLCTEQERERERKTAVNTQPETK